MSAPFASGHAGPRNRGEALPPVNTSLCVSPSCFASFVMATAREVAFQSHSTCAFEFFTRVSSAVKLVDVSGKVISSTISKP